MPCCVHTYNIGTDNVATCTCHWILENWPNCHTKPIYYILLAQLIVTLPVHSAITRLDWLVCFPRVSFSDHIIHNWDNRTYGEHYMKGMGLKFTPGPLTVFGLMAGPSWTHSYTINSPNGGFNTHLTAHPPPPNMRHLWYYIAWLWKELLKIQQC